MGDLVIGAAPALRIATRTALAPERARIGAVIRPLFGEVAAVLAAAGQAPAGPAIALYEPSGAGFSIRAGFVMDAGAPEVPGLAP